MISYYIKVAFRNLKKNAFFSLINIVGLSLSLGLSFIILIYVLNEFSFDKYHENKDRIYRVVCQLNKYEYTTARTPYLLAGSLKSTFPEIADAARIDFPYNISIKKGDGLITERYFVCADNSIFNILTLPIIKGNPDKLLTEPNSLVISESMEKKYFAGEDPIGKILSVKAEFNTYYLNITGVMKDIPQNSSFKAGFIANMSLAINEEKSYYEDPDIENKWDVNSPLTFVLFANKNDVHNVNSKLHELYSKYHNEDIKQKYKFQPVKKMYVGSQSLKNNSLKTGNITNIFVYSIIGVFILIMACFNYIILSTAISISRSKEIAVYKIIGSTQEKLVSQFMGESILVTFLSIPIALILVGVFLPYAPFFLGKEVEFFSANNIKYIIGLFLIVSCISLLSGSYLSFYLSRLDPIKILKNKFIRGKGKASVRKLLLIVQFLIFSCLFVSSFIIHKQLSYIRKANLGFNKDNIIFIDIPNEEFRKNYNPFLTTILEYPMITNASGAEFGPPSNSRTVNNVPKMDEPDKNVIIESFTVDYNYIETLNFQLIMGRSFSEGFGNDSSSIIINEKAMHALGIKGDPVGQKIKGRNIIGVVKDFYMHSFHSEITPMFIGLCPKEWIEEIVIRLAPGKEKESIEFIKDKWGVFAPAIPFSYKTFDDQLRKLYDEEYKFKNNITTFTLLAFFIASLGLIGISIFLAKQRVKEISIKKVFGAPTSTIFKKLIFEYVYLILIASILSAPIVFYFMNKWLHNFSNHINIGATEFVIAAVVSIVLVIPLIIIQTFNVVNSNIIDTIKHE